MEMREIIDLVESLDSTSYSYEKIIGGTWQFIDKTGTDIRVHLKQPPGSKIAVLSFEARNKKGDFTHKTTGNGDSNRVFATVLKILIDNILPERNEIVFRCSTDEKSRFRLYTTIARRIKYAIPEFDSISTESIGKDVIFSIKKN